MVQRWDIITIGNLSRNRYWGESDSQAYRTALCTSTLLRGPGMCLLVDPPIGDPQRMEAELFRRTGLRLGEVRDVFVTHAHGDHVAGLAAFGQANWWAGEAVARLLNGSGTLAKAVLPVHRNFTGPGVEAIPTPGHTSDHHSLRFDCDGRAVVVAGDAVMTREFWDHRQGFFNSVDFAQAAATIESLSKIADIVVPGHDNYFLVGTGGRTEPQGSTR